MNSLAAISALLCSAQIRSRTSPSRRVSPNGRSRVAARAGRDRPGAWYLQALPDDLGGQADDDDAEGLTQGLLIGRVGQGRRRLIHRVGAGGFEPPAPRLRRDRTVAGRRLLSPEEPDNCIVKTL